jgi:hypothetical protein
MKLSKEDLVLVCAINTAQQLAIIHIKDLKKFKLEKATKDWIKQTEEEYFILEKIKLKIYEGLK